MASSVPPLAADVHAPKPRASPVGPVGLIVFALMLGGGAWSFLRLRNHVSTSDAYIDGHIALAAPLVSGRVMEVAVDDNQEVRAGQLLVRLDPSLYQAKVDEAVAQVARARANVTAARAAVLTATAGALKLGADVRLAKANAAEAALEVQRVQSIPAGAVAANTRSTMEARGATTSAQVTAAEKSVSAADARVEAAKSDLSVAEAEVKAAEARAEDARITLSYCTLNAPISGRVARKSVQIGNYVQAGEKVLSVVPLDLFVTANFKETELARIRIGHPARIRVDAVPGRVFRGHVNSLMSGSGSAFALLPPENATGNWVKVVQRVPTKIVFDEPTAGLFGPGMSVEARVLVEEHPVPVTTPAPAAASNIAPAPPATSNTAPAPAASNTAPP